MAQKNTLAQSKQSFSSFATMSKGKIEEVLGGKKGEAFLASIITSVAATPTLASCDYGSILSAALVGSALNLSPSPQLGQFYMVPFRDNKTGITKAQFQIGYRGYVQLAIRSGYYRKLNVVSIKEGELKRFDPLTETIEVDLIDDEAEREQALTIGYYAMFEYQNGFIKAMYWTREKMEAHALKYSQGFASDKRKGASYTFWSKDFDGMAHKTMIRQLISKWGIMSTELQTAYEKDQAVILDDGTPEYIDADVFEVKAPKQENPADDDADDADAPDEAVFHGEPDDLPDDLQESFFG